jgi:hypothetical protein
MCFCMSMLRVKLVLEMFTVPARSIIKQRQIGNNYKYSTVRFINTSVKQVLLT